MFGLNLKTIQHDTFNNTFFFISITAKVSAFFFLNIFILIFYSMTVIISSRKKENEWTWSQLHSHNGEKTNFEIVRTEQKDIYDGELILRQVFTCKSCTTLNKLTPIRKSNERLFSHCWFTKAKGYKPFHKAFNNTGH